MHLIKSLLLIAHLIIILTLFLRIYFEHVFTSIFSLNPSFFWMHNGIFESNIMVPYSLDYLDNIHFTLNFCFTKKIQVKHLSNTSFTSATVKYPSMESTKQIFYTQTSTWPTSDGNLMRLHNICFNIWVLIDKSFKSWVCDLSIHVTFMFERPPLWCNRTTSFILIILVICFINLFTKFTHLHSLSVWWYGLQITFHVRLHYIWLIAIHSRWITIRSS